MNGSAVMFQLQGLYFELVQGMLAMDGDLQQSASLHHHPDIASRCLVRFERDIRHAGFDSDSLPVFEYWYSAFEGSGFSAYHATA